MYGMCGYVKKTSDICNRSADIGREISDIRAGCADIIKPGTSAE